MSSTHEARRPRLGFAVCSSLAALTIVGASSTGYAQVAQDAGVAAVAATPAAPALRLDDGFTWFQVTSVDETQNDRRVDLGYTVSASLRVFGNAPRQSAFVLIFKQGGRDLGRMRCTAEAPGFERDPTFAYLYATECTDRTVRLRAIGDVTVEIRWVDGATDAETVLATRSMSIQRVAQVQGGTPPRAIPDNYYVSQHGRILDSILSWAGFTATDTYPKPYLSESFTGNLVGMTMEYSTLESATSRVLGDLSVRCQVNGTPFQPEESLPPYPVPVQTWSMLRAYIGPGSTGGTSTEEINYRYVTVQMPFRSNELRANPGRWTCDLRSQGRNVRRWAWTVAANGLPAPHAEQTAGLYLGPRAILAETTVPADTPLDLRTSPAEVLRGGFSGRPWVSELARTQAAAVPAVGEAFFPYAPYRDGSSAAPAASTGARRPAGRRRR